MIQVMKALRFFARFSLAMIVLFAACSRDPAPTQNDLNLILIMVDTLRADHMSVYGYERETTPHIAAFARQALLFEQARSQAACTFPSVNSILTSRSPAVFLYQDHDQLGIPTAQLALGEMLIKRGWATAAVSASPVVRNTPCRHNPYGGFGRGFAVFDETCLWKPASCVNRQGIKYLDERPATDQPFFLYLHYIDPHDPYRPPPGRRFDNAFEGPDYITAGDPNPIAEMIYGEGPDLEPADRDLQHLKDLYDAEIASFDEQFGVLMAALRERNLLANTMIVLTADHGEDFLEHGHIKHCRHVFDTSVRVPLIIAVPGVQPRRLTAQVRLLDIVPTVLDYLGVGPEYDALGLNGASLRPLIAGESEEHRLAFASQGGFRSVSDGEYKLIYDGLTGRGQLYALDQDPGEERDICDQESSVCSQLEDELRRWDKRNKTDHHKTLAAARAKMEELKELGYLE